jgi:hypothetical protein
MRLSRGWDGLKGADAAAEAKQEISGNKNDDADIQEQPESESMLNEEARASLVIVLKYRSRKPYQMRQKKSSAKLRRRSNKTSGPKAFEMKSFLRKLSYQ